MKRHLTLMALLTAVVWTADEAAAGFVSSATGNSRFSAGGRSGFVNFAVYINNGAAGNWITDLGTATGDFALADVIELAGSISGAERNVFFFQITRDDALSLTSLTSLAAAFGVDAWTAAGYLSGKVFDDTDGAVVGADAGAVNTLGDPATNGTTGKTTGVAAPGFTTAGGTLGNPSGAILDNGAGAGEFEFLAPVLRGGDHSSVFFFTSHSNPLIVRFATGSVTGGGMMDLPTSNPEPGPLLLVSVGALGGVFGILWQRRRRKQTADVVTAHA